MIIKNSIDKEISLVMEDLDGRAETYLSIEPDYNHSPCKSKENGPIKVYDEIPWAKYVL